MKPAIAVEKDHRKPLSQEELDLVARLRNGDEQAFEEVFTTYKTPIYNYIYRMMGNPVDAEEMTQDTFLKAWLAIDRTDEELRVGAWLYRIGTNVCLDELRHRKLVKWQSWDAFISSFHPSQVASDNPERDCLHREDQREVQELLEQLSPRYRLCLILREYRDLSYDEIAETLSITRAAVKSILFRSRERLREVLVEQKQQREEMYLEVA